MLLAVIQPYRYTENYSKGDKHMTENSVASVFKTLVKVPIVESLVLVTPCSR